MGGAKPRGAMRTDFGLICRFKSLTRLVRDFGVFGAEIQKAVVLSSALASGGLVSGFHLRVSNSNLRARPNENAISYI